jgi:hypothetical protein
MCGRAGGCTERVRSSFGRFEGSRAGRLCPIAAALRDHVERVDRHRSTARIMESRGSADHSRSPCRRGVGSTMRRGGPAGLGHALQPRLDSVGRSPTSSRALRSSSRRRRRPYAHREPLRACRRVHSPRAGRGRRRPRGDARVRRRGVGHGGDSRGAVRIHRRISGSAPDQGRLCRDPFRRLSAQRDCDLSHPRPTISFGAGAGITVRTASWPPAVMTRF